MTVVLVVLQTCSVFWGTEGSVYKGGESGSVTWVGKLFQVTPEERRVSGNKGWVSGFM